MNYKAPYLIPLLYLLSLNTHAEYKTSGQMTSAEYQKVSAAAAEYHDCLDESAISQLDHRSDARIVVDYAMKECAPILENLYDELLLGNYVPGALKRFVNNISHRGANKLLSNVMQYMAGKNNQ